MFRKKNRSKKRSRAVLSAYSIIMILVILLGILSHVLPKAEFVAVTPEEASEIEAEPSVEVGPGEWEGEVPADEAENIVLPEGETVEPEVGTDGLTESRMITDEEISVDEMSNRSGEEIMLISEETGPFSFFIISSDSFKSSVMAARTLICVSKSFLSSNGAELT